MTGRRHCVVMARLVLLTVVVALCATAPARAQEAPYHVVGIKATVTGTDPLLYQADLDVTVYVSSYGSYPFTYIGFPYSPFNLPAIDYGDGNTLASTTLPLAGPGTGPNGTNVYRNAVSFHHTYPGAGNYVVRVTSGCCVGFQGWFKVYYTSNPTTPVFSTSYDTLPTIITGNPAATTRYAGTYTPTQSPSYRLVYSYYGLLALSNTVPVDFAQAVLNVPTASATALVIFGLTLLAAGVWLLRR